MFRVKICGITNAGDAATAARAGADAIGLNFYQQSPRCVAADTAAAIARSLPVGVLKVGLFVNESPDAIRQVVRQANLDAVQLHGDETPQDVAQLAGLRVIKVFRATAERLAEATAFVEECRLLDAPLAAALVDAAVAGQFGGTGVQADWTAASALCRQLKLPVILAGGLTAENVAQAIEAVEPWGVDTASGVEISPGCKDAAQVERFAAAALARFSTRK